MKKLAPTKESIQQKIIYHSGIIKEYERLIRSHKKNLRKYKALLKRKITIDDLYNWETGEPIKK